MEGVLDFGELGHEKIQAKAQENQQKKVTPEFRSRRNWQTKLGIDGHGNLVFDDSGKGACPR